MSVPRAKGFDFGLVAVLESPEHVEGYGTHPAHMKYVLYYSLALIGNWNGANGLQGYEVQVSLV